MLTDTMGDVWSKLTYSLLVASICLFGCVDPQCDSVEKFWDPVVNQCASCPKVCDNGHENDHTCQEYCQGYLDHLANKTSAATAPTTAPNTTAPQPSPYNQNRIVIGISAAAIAIIVFFIIIYLYRKKTKIWDCIKHRFQRTKGPIGQPSDGAGEPMPVARVDLENQEVSFENIQGRE